MKQLYILFLTTLLWMMVTPASAQRKGSIQAMRGVVDGGYNFWLYTPEEHNDGANRRLPLLIFLHGASLCGNNLDRVRRYGTLDALEKGKVIPAYVIAPQNPGGSWNPAKINELLEWMEANYPVDSTRVYVLGMSLGGYGTLDFVGTYPEKVAAAMALCGGTTLRDMQPLGDVPLWIMHGTADRAVSINESKRVVNALQTAGHDKLLRYDWLKGGSHGMPARLFYLQKTYDWLFYHSLADKPREVSRHFDITKDDIATTYSELKWLPKEYEND